MDNTEQLQLKLHKLFAYELDVMIDFEMMDISDKDRLRYAVCLNEEEKNEVTKKQIKKMQKKLDKCSTEIAGYVSALIIESKDNFSEYSNLRKTLCFNFLSEFYEEISGIAESYGTLEAIEEESPLVWQKLLLDKQLINSYSQIDDFIKFILIAERLETYKSFLDKDDNIEKIELKKTQFYNDQNFIQFIKDLEYNYPLYHTPVSSYHQWQSNLKNLKTEILENLIILPESSKNPYLSKLEFELNSHLKYCHTVKKDLVELYDLYETKENDVLRWTSLKNELHIILNTEPSKYEEIEENNYKMNPFVIQKKFYNYHYYFIIKNAIHFISIQKVKYGYIKEEFIETMPVITFDSKNEPTKNYELYSFKYNNIDSSRLTDFMKALKKHNLIDNETKLQDFRKIFNNQEIDIKVIWTGNISELYYLIKLLHYVEKKIENTRQQLWNITSKCFIQSDGNPFDNSKFRSQKAPSTKNKIEEIVKIL